MNLQHLKVRFKVAALLAITTSTVALGILGSTPRMAGADPAFASSYTGVGSDTIQDVFDAFSGAEPYPPSALTAYNVPLHSSATSGSKTISSWDAIPAGTTSPGCIVTKLGGGSFDRPNGSSNGINALRDSILNVGFQNSSASCTGAPASVNGQIDFARSSRGPNAGTSPCTTTGQCLDWVPFARDAVSFAYFDHATNTLATLTSAQLTALYSSASGTITVGTDTVQACLSQSGSGTTKFWEGALGVTDAQAVAAATASGCYNSAQAITGGGLEENGGNSFYAYASTLPAGTDAVIDFSSGSWISQANAVASDRSATARTNGVDLGAIDALGKPYTGAAPSEGPSTGFYASTTYGRDVYVVVSATKFGFPGDPGMKSLFNGAASVICSAGAAATSLKFGFPAPLQSCGVPITANLVGS
jgi:hypothetical protein